MKNKIAIVGVALTAAYSGFAQGEVQFQNTAQTGVKVNTSGALSTFSSISGGASAYYFALFNSVSATTVAGAGTAAVIPTGVLGSQVAGSYAFQDSNWTLDAYGASTATVGRFSSINLDSNGQTLVSGAPANTQLVVVGWSANIGTSIASVESFLAGTDNGVTSGFIGESIVSGSITTGNGATGTPPVPTIFSTSLAGDITGFDLGYYQVPEPSSIALGVMGAASLLALRRKKA